ncbi:fatty acid desaturase [Janthinobacterium lividum]|uniref:fatty acid desaturase n=1 Tax=Janthinobacterium lividum TaxID=29581 RepID=UPI00044BDCB7|nr:fatty acid desaturase [Janthinobacterium lividum]EZP36716.1 Fatty acid desaturase [Janthinobacterium lividum]
MLDYLKYTLSPLLLLVSAYGLWSGGNHVWLGGGVLLGILLFDAFLAPDHSLRDSRYPWLYDSIVCIQLTLAFGLILLYAWLIGSGHFTTVAQQTGAFITMLITQFVLATPALHEMFHRENTFLRWFGRLGMVMIFDPWREITHVVTHHVHTVTPTDPDYARRGENLYRHLLHTFREQIIESYQLEKRLWTKRGRPWWHPRNAWVWRAGLLLGFVVLLHLIGGWSGAVAGVAVCLLGPRTFLEIFNYCQHYGLVTGKPGRFENHQTWNHLTPFVRILALEITNHAGHHQDGYKPFYELVPDRDGPKQPQFLVCVLLACVPPLWFMMIRPLLRDWDRRYASPQEREIAAAENIRAGWADLNDEPEPAQRRHAVAA